MITRKALIVGAPDNKIPGVKVDVENLRSFFKSPVGGLWYDFEIKVLMLPSLMEIRREIDVLKEKDYSVIFFAGHGYFSEQRKRTILHINAMETMDSLELRVGAQKHSLLLDCCRKREDDRRSFKMESMVLDHAEGQQLNSVDCRAYFDKAVSGCDNGIVVMNSCAINETAGENDSEGGYYTSSLIDCANDWAREKLVTIDLARNYTTLSTQDCHNRAVKQVRLLSGGRQNPTFDSPRVENKFPFAVVA